MRTPFHSSIPLRLLAAVTASFIMVSLLRGQTAPATPPAQSAQGQITPQADPERQHALELYRAGKMVQAMPLFEKLSVRYPNDQVVWEAWGVSALGYSQTLPDADSRKKARVQARSILVKTKEMGDNSNLLQNLLGMIPEDGGEGTYSSTKEVNNLMQQAEADFSRGDYDKARDGYLRALLLEPKNYDAALFIGDVYFKQHINGSAGEWFARAVEIDPNRETAYRYWGDALWAMGKSADAREKYIQAIIADPYNNRSWTGLNQWAQRTKVQLNWVRLQDKSRANNDGKNTTITLDTSLQKDDPALGAWLIYAANRAQWQKEKFKQEFPKEPSYRHTLREEVDSLRMMVELVSKPEVVPKLDPSFAGLVKIDQAGFLEPFALLNRADKDIVQDYIPYRAAHRDTIYRYFDEFVVPKAAS
jgi:tetratricopeptide (TPR) repeat protein